jgi:hypothetical protein
MLRFPTTFGLKRQGWISSSRMNPSSSKQRWVRVDWATSKSARHPDRKKILLHEPTAEKVQLFRCRGDHADESGRYSYSLYRWSLGRERPRSAGGTGRCFARSPPPARPETSAMHCWITRQGKMTASGKTPLSGQGRIRGFAYQFSALKQDGYDVSVVQNRCL